MTVAVLGGGVTGLTAAWKLAQAGHTVRLLESGARLGGSVRTIRASGWLFDPGPNAVREDERTRALIEELGLSPERLESSPAAKARFVVHRGALVSVPSASSPADLLTTPLLTMGARLRIAAEAAFKPRVRAGDVSVADFVREHFGEVVLERAGQPLASGIWAGDTERLSVRYAFPQAWEAERSTGSLIRALAEASRTRKALGVASAKVISFRGGMQALTEALASKVGKASVVLNAEVHALGRGKAARWRVRWKGPDPGEEEFDWVVCALPPAALASLVLGRGARPLESLAAIECPPVASVAVGFRREQVAHALEGFGALVPAAEKRSILGVIFSSSLFPGRAPQGHVLVTVLVGGALNPGAALLPAEELKRRVCDDLGDLLGAEGKPAFFRHTLWPRAIPQYNLGFGEHLATMEKAERDHPGILIGGSARDGISIPECLASGAGLSKRVS
jgi:oxygen-dependent protoporphyrinogen oxidase